LYLQGGPGPCNLHSLKDILKVSVFGSTAYLSSLRVSLRVCLSYTSCAPSIVVGRSLGATWPIRWGRRGSSCWGRLGRVVGVESLGAAESLGPTRLSVGATLHSAAPLAETPRLFPCGQPAPRQLHRHRSHRRYKRILQRMVACLQNCRMPSSLALFRKVLYSWQKKIRVSIVRAPWV
jgi:hypothetical protein